jgi:hypothetical protein
MANSFVLMAVRLPLADDAEGGWGSDHSDYSNRIAVVALKENDGSVSISASGAWLNVRELWRSETSRRFSSLEQCCEVVWWPQPSVWPCELQRRKRPS